MILQILLTAFFVFISSFFFKPYWKNPTQRRFLIRFGLILLPLSIIGYFTVMYINHYSKPDSFEQGIELLHYNKEIKNKIGDFDAYSFYDRDLPKKIDNPAFFKIELQGSLATIYITCKVQKDKSGQWHIITIKQDSLKKQGD